MLIVGATLIVFVFSAICPEEVQLFDLNQSDLLTHFETATDSRNSSANLTLDGCPDDPSTSGPEVVVGFYGRENGTLITGHWEGDHEAVVYAQFRVDGATECVSSCALGNGTSADLLFETQYTIDSEGAHFYVVVDAAQGVSGEGRLTLDIDIGVPILEHSWGVVKSRYRPANQLRPAADEPSVTPLGASGAPALRVGLS